MDRGLFITFEGGEGVGKTTLINALKDIFLTPGAPVIFTREPGGSERAESLRAILLHENDAHTEMSIETETLIVCAARSDHVDMTIKPALERGITVFCDRFADSTRAYQGGDVDEDLIEASIALATKGLEPDLTILLDGDPRVLQERRKKRDGATDRFEVRGIPFHEDVREAFLGLAALYPGRFAVIDAEQAVEIVLQKTLDTLKTRLNLVPDVQGLA